MDFHYPKKHLAKRLEPFYFESFEVLKNCYYDVAVSNKDLVLNGFSPNRGFLNKKRKIIFMLPTYPN